MSESCRILLYRGDISKKKGRNRIIEGICGGEDKTSLAYKLGMKKRSLLFAYEDAMERAHSQRTHEATEMLRELGFQPFYSGVGELETSVQLAAARPELMDCM